MSISPLITFKAGQCEVEASSRPLKVTPQVEQGYIYLYSEDDLIHFCWRTRSKPLDDPELDLVMVPTDGSFVPYEDAEHPSAKTNGRIFVLKFNSSSARYIFWLQSKPQSRDGDQTWISPRDHRIGEIVNRLLQGEEVNVTQELRSVNNSDNRPADDDDEPMEDVEGQGESGERRGSGGAGPDATGGDVREEGEESREGGADGARAFTSRLEDIKSTGLISGSMLMGVHFTLTIVFSSAAESGPTDATTAVRNFLDSLQGQPELRSSLLNASGVIPPIRHNRGGPTDVSYPHLNHLIPTNTTLKMIKWVDEDVLDAMLRLLPPTYILLMTGQIEVKDLDTELDPEAYEESLSNLPADLKQDVLKEVLRSPQFQQALASLNRALLDGGMPTIADAMGIHVANQGFFSPGIPMGGEAAIKAFVEGIKNKIEGRIV